MIDNSFIKFDGSPVTGRAPLSIRAAPGIDPANHLNAIASALNRFKRDVLTSVTNRNSRAYKIPGGVTATFTTSFGRDSVVLSFTPGVDRPVNKQAIGVVEEEEILPGAWTLTYEANGIPVVRVYDDEFINLAAFSGCSVMPSLGGSGAVVYSVSDLSATAYHIKKDGSLAATWFQPYSLYSYYLGQRPSLNGDYYEYIYTMSRATSPNAGTIMVGRYNVAYGESHTDGYVRMYSHSNAASKRDNLFYGAAYGRVVSRETTHENWYGTGHWYNYMVEYFNVATDYVYSAVDIFTPSADLVSFIDYSGVTQTPNGTLGVISDNGSAWAIPKWELRNYGVSYYSFLIRWSLVGGFMSDWVYTNETSDESWMSYEFVSVTSFGTLPFHVAAISNNGRYMVFYDPMVVTSLVSSTSSGPAPYSPDWYATRTTTYTQAQYAQLSSRLHVIDTRTGEEIITTGNISHQGEVFVPVCGVTNTGALMFVEGNYLVTVRRSGSFNVKTISRIRADGYLGIDQGGGWGVSQNGKWTGVSVPVPGGAVISF